MKKLINFLFVRRPEIENKWWHRLFIVFLVGSGIIVFIITVSFTVINFYPKWVMHGDDPLSFSLESNYEKINGKELPCNVDLSAFHISSTEPNINGWGVKCEGVNLSEFDSKRYAKLYSTAHKNLRTQYGFDKYSDDSICAINDRACQLNIIWKGFDLEKADPSYNKFQIEEKNLTRIKVSAVANFWNILLDIMLLMVVPAIVLTLWILFWDSIIYRSILYIIYGNKK